MPQHDIVVIGASAGGLQALTAIVERLPRSLRACVLVVVHSSAEADGILPNILSKVSALPVAYAKNGAQLAPGRIFIAPRDHHLIVTDHQMRLVRGPRENGFRPAVDPLFRTAARSLGPRVVGVVLSGGLSDGTYGLGVIKHHGGFAIVQDPDDAIISSMPKSAIDDVDVDLVLRAAEIAPAIERLTTAPAAKEGESTMARDREIEPQLATEETAVAEMKEEYGAPSALTCPDCGGALWEVQDGRSLRYQCHVGHQYAIENLEEDQREAVDSALWSAVRVLEEHAELKMRMARRAAAGGMATVSEGYVGGARDAHQHAQRIRSLIFSAGTALESPRRTQREERPATPAAEEAPTPSRRAGKTRNGRNRS